VCPFTGLDYWTGTLDWHIFGLYTFQGHIFGFTKFLLTYCLALIKTWHLMHRGTQGVMFCLFIFLQFLQFYKNNSGEKGLV